MSHGFDFNSPLVCEGIIGDGCGGGRIFFIKDEILFAYDPLSKINKELLKGLKNIKAISKKGCIITLDFEDEIRLFDLSSLRAQRNKKYKKTDYLFQGLNGYVNLYQVYQ